jgi:hypothetical protein
MGCVSGVGLESRRISLMRRWSSAVEFANTSTSPRKLSEQNSKSQAPFSSHPYKLRICLSCPFPREGAASPTRHTTTPSAMSTATRPHPPLMELLSPSVHGDAMPDSPVPVAGEDQASSILDAAAAAAAAAPWTGREGSKPTLSTLPVEIAQMILARLDFSSLDSFELVSRHSSSLVSTLPENKAIYKEFRFVIKNMRLFHWQFHFTPLGMLAGLRAMKRELPDDQAELTCNCKVHFHVNQAFLQQKYSFQFLFLYACRLSQANVDARVSTVKPLLSLARA